MNLIAYETYRKRGRSWQYLGERTAESMRGAALQVSYVHHVKVVAVCPAGSLDITIHDKAVKCAQRGLPVGPNHLAIAFERLEAQQRALIGGGSYTPDDPQTNDGFRVVK